MTTIETKAALRRLVFELCRRPRSLASIADALDTPIDDVWGHVRLMCERGALVGRVLPGEMLRIEYRQRRPDAAKLIERLDDEIEVSKDWSRREPALRREAA